jgi:hypothetical protein
MCGLLFLGMLFLALPGLALPVLGADEKEMVANPMYQHWASFKPGATAVLQEKTIFGGDARNERPGGVDVKVINQRLLSVSPQKVVVATTVVEDDFLGTVETAPARHTYPTMIPKANFEAVLHEHGAKPGPEETVKAAGMDIKCKVYAGTYKKGAAEVTFKLWYSDSVPGGIVKRTRLTKQDGKVIADTTIMLESFSTTPPKEEK